MRESLPSKIAKRLFRQQNALADFLAASLAYKYLKSTTNEDLKFIYFQAMVISYGRPFTKNLGIGSLEIDFPDYPTFDIEDGFVRHLRLLDLRDKFVAHSSCEGLQVFLVPKGEINPATEQIASELEIAVAKRTFSNEVFIDWLHELVTAGIAHLNGSTRQLLSTCRPGCFTEGVIEIPRSRDLDWSAERRQPIDSH